MRRLLAVITILASACALAGAAQDDPGFSIRFFEKKVYFLGDEILVEALIVNTGAATIRFKVAENRVFNLDFDVRTPTNVALEHAREFTTQRTSDQPVFFREMSLEPGEQYAIVVDLARYAAFDAARPLRAAGLVLPRAVPHRRLGRPSRPTGSRSTCGPVPSRRPCARPWTRRRASCWRATGRCRPTRW